MGQIETGAEPGPHVCFGSPRSERVRSQDQFGRVSSKRAQTTPRPPGTRVSNSVVLSRHPFLDGNKTP